MTAASKPIPVRSPRRARLARILAGLILLGLLLGGLTLTALFAAMDSQPLQIASKNSPSANDLREGRQRLQQIVHMLSRRGQPQRLEIRQRDIDNFLALAERGIGGLSGRADIGPAELDIALSYRIRFLGRPRFLNAVSAVAANQRGLDIPAVKIGALRLPAPIVKSLLGALVDRQFGDGVFRDALASVKRVQSRGDRLLLDITPQRNFREVAKQGQMPLDPAVDPALVEIYLATARQKLPPRAKNQPYPLEEALSVLLGAAGIRSGQGGDPVAENQAALVALGIAGGHYRLAHLAGVKIGGRRLPAVAAALSGRHDLAQHFAVSAALEILTDGRMTETAGIFKEVFDSGSGGSGFSFADLRADEAGRLFARQATASASQARAAQRLIRTAHQEHIFQLSGQEQEGMNEQTFKARYGSVDSPAFSQMLERIRRDLSALRFYRRVKQAA